MRPEGDTHEMLLSFCVVVVAYCVRSALTYVCFPVIIVSAFKRTPRLQEAVCLKFTRSNKAGSTGSRAGLYLMQVEVFNANMQININRISFT